MAFNPNIINTNVPPPNYPNMQMRFPSNSINSCPPPIPQHMFNTGMHVPPTNSASFSVVPPPIGLGSVQNTMQTMWNNNALSLSAINGQNFTSAPPILNAHNTQITDCFQVPPTLQNNQVSIWNNSINQPQNNLNGLLAIAPNSSSGNNPQNMNFTHNFNVLQTPIKSDFESSTNQYNGNHSSFWTDNISNNEPFKPPPTINHMPMKDNQNHSLVWSSNNSSSNGPLNHVGGNQSLHNVNMDSNAFTRENTWNTIEKTNVPDSNIFQNPSAIFNMAGNNTVLNAPVNGVIENKFQDINVINNIPMNQGDVNFSQKFNSLHNSNFIPINGDTVPSSNKPLQNQNRYQFANDVPKLNANRFHQTKKQNMNHHNNNLKQDKDYGAISHRFEKPNCGNRPNLPFQPNNQNLIDVSVVSNRDKGKFMHTNFHQASNYCGSNSSSTVVEEYTVSDSESVDSKNSPLKHQRNRRIFENLQKISPESNNDNSQYKMGWMTESIQKALQKRNMLFKQAKATNDQAVWDEYNKLKNEINEEIRLAKLNTKNHKPRRNIPQIWQDKGKKLPFNCDTCDRGFSSNDELESHMALHVKCHYQGCNFEAHPKIVNLHQRMQHDTGYADVINKLQNDEEIKKWREERKRRFPTAENILKRKAEQAEKEARGEVIEEKDHGRFKKRRFEDRKKDNFLNRHDKNNRKRRPRNPFQKAPEIDLAQDSGSDGESECTTKLPKFRGMKNGYDYLSTSDVKIEEKDDTASNQTSEVSLSQVNSSKQDMKELDDDEAPLEIPIQKVSLNESSDSADENDNEALAKENQQELHETVAENSSSTRPNIDEKSNNNEKSSLPSKDNKGNKRERNEKRCRPPVPPRPKNSLLKMLLSDEIRHERNVIMQCVRHIVKNNFFRNEADT